MSVFAEAEAASQNVGSGSGVWSEISVLGRVTIYNLVLGALGILPKHISGLRFAPSNWPPMAGRCEKVAMLKPQPWRKCSKSIQPGQATKLVSIQSTFLHGIITVQVYDCHRTVIRTKYSNLVSLYKYKTKSLTTTIPLVHRDHVEWRRKGSKINL